MKRIDQFLFFDSSPEKLAILRIFFYSTFLWHFKSTYFYLSLHAWPKEMWNNSPWFSWLGLQTLHWTNHEWMIHAWSVSIFFCLVGFCYRIMAPICAIFGFYFLSSTSGVAGESVLWTYALGLPCLAMFIFMIPPANDCFSVDSFIFDKNKDKRNSWNYSWPIQFLKVAFVTTFFYTSINRIELLGLEILWSDRFFDSVIIKKYFFCKDASISINCIGLSMLLEYPFLSKLSFFLVQIIELFSLILLFQIRYSWLILLGLAFFQISTRIILMENFLIYWPFYFLWASNRFYYLLSNQSLYLIK